MSTKVYDSEETQQEQARRLIADAVNKRSVRTYRLRDRMRLYIHRLSRRDREALTEFLRREDDITVAFADLANNEPSEFRFPSELVDEEWNL